MIKELNKLQRLKTQLKLYNNKSVKKFSLKGKLQLLKTISYHKWQYHNGKIVFHSIMPPFPSQAFDKQMIAMYNLARGKITPTTVHFCITDSCRYNCWHCSRFGKKGKSISHETIKKTIKKLLDEGTLIFSFTGGEPLLNTKINEYLEIIKKSNAYSQIFTTGFSLDEKKAKELKNSGLYYPIISLDHYTPEIVNKLRGHPDAFNNAVSGAKNCINAGMYTTLQAVITPQLLTNNGIWKYLNLAKKIGVNEVRFLEQLPCGKLIGNEKLARIKYENEKITKVIFKANKLINFPTVIYMPYFESEQLSGCVAGQLLIYIDTQGNVCPCDFVPLSFGNVKNDSLKNILKKMKSVLNKPLSDCLCKRISPHIKYSKKFPLSSERALEICKKCREKNLTEYYKNLKSKKPRVLSLLKGVVCSGF